MILKPTVATPPYCFENIENRQNILFYLYVKVVISVHLRKNRSRENASTFLHLAHTLAKYEQVRMFCRLINSSPCSAVWRREGHVCLLLDTAEVLLRRVIRWIDLYHKFGQSCRQHCGKGREKA